MSVLTPPGRGAVATVAVVGAQATERVSSRFGPASRRPLEEFPIGRIAFGRWTGGLGAGEEVVVCRRSEQLVEIHCHGGRMAAAAMVESLVAAGCREIPWQQMAAHYEPDAIAAEARVALAAARTERTAAILLDQYRGALRSALVRIAHLLEGGDVANAKQQLAALEQSAQLGRHLTTPWQVVLAGEPNVGKSSLINALVGYRRAIVYAQPGTTRDVVTAWTAADGWPVELADTAGLQKSEDPIEAAGIALAQRRLAAADAVVLVFDGTQPWSGASTSLVDAWPEAIRVYNKSDLDGPPPGDRPAGLRTSAVTGRGVPELIAHLAVKLVPHPPPPGAAILFTDRQVELIVQCRKRLAAGGVDEAKKLLQTLL